jgi:hypothetical protein
MVLASAPCTSGQADGYVPRTPAGGIMRVLVGILVLALVSPALAGFRGTPYTRHQLLTRCYTSCATYRDVCRTTFVKGRVYRHCVKRLMYACLGAGGACNVGPCPVCAADQVCVNGMCFRKPKPKQPTVQLPPGNYNVSFCASGAVTIACQAVGTFPIVAFDVFEQAIQSAMTQFLAANGAAGCALGTGQVANAGGGVDVTFSATCTDPVSGTSVSESVVLQVRP